MPPCAVQQANPENKAQRTVAHIQEMCRRLYLGDSERKMQSDPLRDDEHEQALLKRELDAFERRQRALISITANHQIYGNGGGQPGAGISLPLAALDEFRAADAEWRAARDECERVVDEIGLAI
jgi:hypothetical protein